MITSAVIDANVGIKLFIIEDGSEKVDELFDQLSAVPSARFYIPDLFYIECANILWKYVRRFNYPAESAFMDIADLQALNLLVVSTADLLHDALELALVKNVTAYDACYAALARQLDLPLITADVDLQQKFDGTGIAVWLLSEI